MARIAGINVPSDKRVEIALTYVYGIGRSTSQQILNTAGIQFDVRVKDISETDLNKIRDEIKKMLVEGDLRRKVGGDVKRLKDIGCYRGIRHLKGLPLRGQRTRTNSRTRKGKRKTVANKKKETK